MEPEQDVGGTETQARADAAAHPQELPLTPFAEAVERAVGKLIGRPKHCGKSAFLHLRRAWRLLGTDDEMAAFRAITAEEEAATALIHALRSKGYPGAELLRLRNHVHKAAFFPFLIAVGKVFAVAEHAEPQVFIEEDQAPPRVLVRFNGRKLLGLPPGEPIYMAPDPPLHMLIRRNGTVDDFTAELAQVAKGNGLADIRKFLEEEANLRNRLLYASDNGVPHAEVPDGFVLERARRVTVLLTVLLLVEQSQHHQLLVTQCVQALIRILPRLPPSIFDFDQAVPEDTGDRIVVKKPFGGEPIALLHRSYALKPMKSSRICRLLPVCHVQMHPFSFPSAPLDWTGGAPEE